MDPIDTNSEDADSSNLDIWEDLNDEGEDQAEEELVQQVNEIEEREQGEGHQQEQEMQGEHGGGKEPDQAALKEEELAQDFGEEEEDDEEEQEQAEQEVDNNYNYNERDQEVKEEEEQEVKEHEDADPKVLLKDISKQLSEVVQVQSSILASKNQEVEQLRRRIHAQEQQLEAKEREIRRLELERYRQQEERAVELRTLIRRTQTPGTPNNALTNPYQAQDESGFLEGLCGAIGSALQFFSESFTRNHSSRHRSRRRGMGGMENAMGNATNPPAMKTTDCITLVVLCILVFQMLRFSILIAPAPPPSLSTTSYKSPGSHYSSYSHDYHDYHDYYKPKPEPPPKLKPWESKPPLAIPLFQNSEPAIIQRHTCIQRIRQRHVDLLGPWIAVPQPPQKEHVLLVDPAYHANVGDHMLTLGELQFLNHSLPAFMMEPTQCHYVQAGGFFSTCTEVIRSSKRNINKIALWHAGGNWGDLWRDAQDVRLDSFRTLLLHNYTIVGMPQSLYYKDKYLQKQDVQEVKEKLLLGLGYLSEEEDEPVRPFENEWSYHRRSPLSEYEKNPWNYPRRHRRLLDEFEEKETAEEREKKEIAEEREEREGYLGRHDDHLGPWGGGGGGGLGRHDDIFFTKPRKQLNTSILDHDPIAIKFFQSKVIFTWREQESYDLATELYPFVTNLVVPDIAFQLGPYAPIRNWKHRKYQVDLMVFLRNDLESKVSEKRDNEYIQKIIAAKSGGKKFTSTVVDWPDRLKLFQTKDEFFTDTSIELLSLGKVVICDRLHAAVLAYLVGLPFVYIDQVSGKISKTLNVAFDTDDCRDGKKSMWARAMTLEGAIEEAVDMINRYQLNDQKGFLRGLIG